MMQTILEKKNGLDLKYADRLGDVLLEIYDQIDSLSTNVNTYFLESPDGKGNALKARENAIVLKKDTEELV